jgi:DNA-binding LacI/PurR family transcriptional regulator
MVAVDRRPNGLDVDLVATNNRESVKEAVLHLLSHGYKTIGFINGPAGLDVTQDRLAGYQDALLSAKIPYQETLVVYSDFRQSGGWEAMSKILDLPKRPRAVVVANNLMTLGALQAIHERNVRIPNDLAVISFDDMPWAVSLRPPLTALAQPAEELGRTSAQLLLDRLKDPHRPSRQVILPSHLIVRASCGSH